MVSLVIADKCPTMRAGFHLVFDTTDDIRIIGEAKNDSEVRIMLERVRPQVLLLDLQEPIVQLVKLEEWVRLHCPGTKTLLLFNHDRDVCLTCMMNAGIAGYLTKNETAERLIKAIRFIAEKRMLFTKEQFHRVIKWRGSVGDRWESLTGREKEIIKLLMQGLNNKIIGEKLFITTKTVAYHITSILKKLGINSRLELVIWVYKYIPDELDNYNYDRY